MKKQKYLGFIAIFIAVLVMTLPVSYAQSMSIIKNSGQAEVQDNDDGYINAYDDTWTLQVNVQGMSSVTPQQVKVNSFNFDSCAPGISGFDCIYSFAYPGASMPETQYPLTIDLYDSSFNLKDTETATITADGSGPRFINLNVHQDGSQVQVDMTILDEPTHCAGLGKIEIFDVESNALLYTLEDTELSDQITSQCGENDLSVTVNFPSAGNITKTGRVVAYDRLGNQRTATDSFTFDYNLPVVLSNSFALDNFGNYIPSGSKVIDVYLNVSEDGDTLTVEATSSDLGWVNEQATCQKVDYVNDVFTCVWQNINVVMSSSMSLSVTVSDGANTVTQPISKTFIVDSTPPVIDYLGAGVFDGFSYISPNNNEIKVVFEEGQSGVNVDTVKADLSEINIYKSTQTPADNCSRSGTKWTCYWYDIDQATAGKIYLVDAQDQVGNNVDTTSSKAAATLIMDNVDPVISNIEIIALGSEGPVGFYQSRDVLQINFDIREANGATAQVDLSDIVTDFSGVVNDNGIVSAACTQRELEITEVTEVNITSPTPLPIFQQTETITQPSLQTLYDCTALSPRIKSGYEKDVEIKIIATDTGGNQVEKIEKIEILGLSNEPDPDFWKVGGVTASPGSLDIATIPFINQRVFFTIPLVRKNSRAILLGVTLDECTGDTAQLSQSFMIGNMFGSTSPRLVLEVTAFTPTVDLNFNCTLNIFSRRGNEAIVNPEKEVIPLTVSFHQSEFDSQQAALDEKIHDAKKDVKYGIWGTIGVLNKIVQWSKTFCQLKDIYNILDFIWNVIQGKFDALRSNPYTQSTAISACYTSKTGDKAKESSDDLFTKYCKMISCQLNILEFIGDEELLDTDLGGSWYNEHVTANFNKWEKAGYEGDDLDKLKAEAKVALDPYDSIVVAIAYLCLPAIIYNLEKYRQIECRYISCLENEVKNGVATVNACEQLKSYQVCKYFVGAIFYALPFVGLIDAVLSKIQNMLKDPVGLLRLAIGLACSETTCPTSNEAKSICVYLAFLFAVMDLINDLIAMYEGYQTINSDYCSEMGLTQL